MGKLGTGPGEFRNAHALAFDSRGRVFVGDRGNSRLQIFDSDGKFIAEWKQFGRPSGLYIDKDDKLYVIDADSTPATNTGWKKGIRIGSAKDGKVVAFIPGHQTDNPDEPPARVSSRIRPDTIRGREHPPRRDEVRQTVKEIA